MAPEYEIRSDGGWYRLNHGFAVMPEYQIHRDGKIYRTIAHPDGPSLLADYDLFDSGMDALF